MKKKVVILGVAIAVVAAAVITGLILFNNKKENPEAVLNEYIQYINNKNYEGMYKLIDSSSQQSISSADFAARNKNIYEGIDAGSVSIEIQNTEKVNNSKKHGITKKRSKNQKNRPFKLARRIAKLHRRKHKSNKK